MMANDVPAHGDISDGAPPPRSAPEIPTTTAVTPPLDDALADPTLPRVPGTSAGDERFG